MRVHGLGVWALGAVAPLASAGSSIAVARTGKRRGFVNLIPRVGLASAVEPDHERGVVHGSLTERFVEDGRVEPSELGPVERTVVVRVERGDDRLHLVRGDVVVGAGKPWVGDLAGLAAAPLLDEGEELHAAPDSVAVVPEALLLGEDPLVPVHVEAQKRLGVAVWAGPTGEPDGGIGVRDDRVDRDRRRRGVRRSGERGPGQDHEGEKKAPAHKSAAPGLSSAPGRVAAPGLRDGRTAALAATGAMTAAIAIATMVIRLKSGIINVTLQATGRGSGYSFASANFMSVTSFAFGTLPAGPMVTSTLPLIA